MQSSWAVQYCVSPQNTKRKQVKFQTQEMQANLSASQ